MKITVTFPNPSTIENWDKPTAWQTKEVEVDTEKIISIQQHTWHNKFGVRLNILNGSAMEWHFLELSETTKQFIEMRLKQIQSKRAALLDEHGLFGGGTNVNKTFQRLNFEYDALLNI